MTTAPRVSRIAAAAALLLAPAAFAGPRIPFNRAAPFWNFPDTVTADSVAGRDNVIRFSPNGGDLGNFVLKLAARHNPTGFAANSFAFRFAHFREFEKPVGIFDAAESLAVSRFTPDLLLADSFAAPKDRISVIVDYQEGDGGGPGGGGGPTVPEPSTIFGAAIGFVALLWMQRRRLVALLART